MRILVYGAGVLGCELAHVLMQNKKNVVTLLARGEWKEMIDQKGLVIRHWVQRKTTTERIKTVDTLAPDDYYDLVFVVVQAGQLPDVLPVLKANKSQYFVFVGNNPQAKQVLEQIYRKDACILQDRPIQVYVDSLGDSAVVLGARGWLEAANYWDTRWRILEQIKLQFDAEGIEIPFNQLDVHIHK